MSTELSPATAGDPMAEQQRREMSLRYRLAHTRGAARVRWDAYDLACLYLTTGRPEHVTPKAIHELINGGRCMMSPVRVAIADARRDCAAANLDAGRHCASDVAGAQA
jgi:hypothetical protein